MNSSWPGSTAELTLANEPLGSRRTTHGMTSFNADYCSCPVGSILLALDSVPGKGSRGDAGTKLVHSSLRALFTAGQSAIFTLDQGS